MEQSGMRWRIVGAQAILSLRAIYVNDDWEAFHKDRIQTEQHNLYPGWGQGQSVDCLVPVRTWSM